MKVLHIDTGTTWRGGQAQIYNLLKYFPEGNVTNYLLCPSESPLPTRLKKNDVDVNVFHHPLRGEWDLSAGWRIRTLHNRLDFDLLHAHSSRALGICWTGSLLFDYPPFIETRRLQTPVAENIFSQWKYDSAHHHVANSETVQETLVNCGIPRDETTVIPSGIDFEKIQNTEPDYDLVLELGLSPEKPIIGNIGALTRQKDQKTFIEAASEVLEDDPDAQFLIAGEGELHGDLQERISERGVTDNVVLAGFVDNIFGLIKTFDLFVLTSLYEGLCGTIMQVMASRVPVITADIKGSRQIIHDGENCRAVKPGDVEGFTKRIREYLNDPASYDRFLDHAEKTAQEYDYREIASRTESFYKSLTEGC